MHGLQGNSNIMTTFLPRVSSHELGLIIYLFSGHAVAPKKSNLSRSRIHHIGTQKY